MCWRHQEASAVRQHAPKAGHLYRESTVLCLVTEVSLETAIDMYSERINRSSLPLRDEAGIHLPKERAEFDAHKQEGAV